MVRGAYVEWQKALELKKSFSKFLCILNDILKSQAQKGMHQNVFFGWQQQNFIPYYFHHSYSYHFSKNRQAVSRIPTLNNELGVTEGSVKWKIFYWHRHYSSRLFWHFYCLLNVGRVGESGELRACTCVCMHAQGYVWLKLAFYESPEISAIILNKGLGRFIILLNCSSKSFT